MSDKPKPYIVRQGDTLLRIAIARGLDPKKIWDEPKNKELKDRRDPDVLAVGDIVQLPPPPPLTMRLNPKTSNSFQAKVPEVEVNLVFEGEAGPLANEEYKITGITEEPIEGALDALGKVRVVVPLFLEQFTIKFEKRNIEHTVWPGYLDPVDVQSGICQRLLHLGFGPVAQKVGDPFVFAEPDAEREAIKGFQKAFGLEPTGFGDEETQNRLRARHGY